MSRRRRTAAAGPAAGPRKPKDEDHAPGPAVNPPRPNKLLLGASSLMLAAWIVFLLVLAVLG